MISVWFSRAAVAVTIAGAVCGVLASLKFNEGHLSLGGTFFLGWTLFPFILALVALVTRRASVIAGLVLGGASAWGLAAYVHLLSPYHRLRSTSGLDLVFIPLWQTLFIGAAMLLALAAEAFSRGTRCKFCNRAVSRVTGICPNCGQHTA